MTITFTKLQRYSIFTKDFDPFEKNNTLDFSSGIAVLYGPNGIGKSSLVAALEDKEDTSLSFSVDGVSYSSGSGVFHIISDQNNRNIIAGETHEFLLGDDISREYRLEKSINGGYEAFLASCASELKAVGISSGSSPLVAFFPDGPIKQLVKDLAKASNRGSNSKNIESLKLLADLDRIEIPISGDIQVRLDFLVSDYNKKDKSLIKQIEALSGQSLTAQPAVKEIEENTEAISILKRFSSRTDCIVCDTPNIDPIGLLEKKEKRRSFVLKPLDDRQRLLIEQAIALVPSDDPFAIKETLIEAMEKGDNAAIIALIESFDEIKHYFIAQVLSKLSAFIKDSSLIAEMKELEELQEKNPVLTEEDLVFLQEIISNSMDKALRVARDSEKRFIITLDDEEFLGADRGELALSSGEQNFLSLTFEFLRAKNSLEEYVVIDDPVSSFDSIYKNKVVYALVRMLRHKKRIVLTHNIDLIRLLSVQHRGCFTLYLLNNTEGGENGFIALNSEEQRMLVDLSCLLKTFRESIFPSIVNQELFLCSMIPFMRGYASIIGDKDCKDALTLLMHGYDSECVDIAEIYRTLFNIKDDRITEHFETTVPDLLALNLEDETDPILDCSTYPLLNKTLQHSLSYLYLRLLVEKSLIETSDFTVEENMQLGEIIDKAFPEPKKLSTEEEREQATKQTRRRVFLTSRKTLINEFNHFEGNLSIFQPAIDISDQMLKNEREGIVEFVGRLVD